jgi:hypothetical protein
MCWAKNRFEPMEEEEEIQKAGNLKRVSGLIGV